MGLVWIALLLVLVALKQLRSALGQLVVKCGWGVAQLGETTASLWSLVIQEANLVFSTWSLRVLNSSETEQMSQCTISFKSLIVSHLLHLTDKPSHRAKYRFKNGEINFTY